MPSQGRSLFWREEALWLRLEDAARRGSRNDLRRDLSVDGDVEMFLQGYQAVGPTWRLLWANRPEVRSAEQVGGCPVVPALGDLSVGISDSVYSATGSKVGPKPRFFVFLASSVR